MVARVLFVFLIGLGSLQTMPLQAENGYIVEPYIQECDTGAGCSEASVPWSVLVDRCGDSDGCTMRITLTTSSPGFRAPGVSLAFAVDDTGNGWNANPDGETAYGFLTSGTNGDGADEQLLLMEFGLTASCTFSDDTATRPTQLSFELVATPEIAGSVVCAVRIDD